MTSGSYREGVGNLPPRSALLAASIVMGWNFVSGWSLICRQTVARQWAEMAYQQV